MSNSLLPKCWENLDMEKIKQRKIGRVLKKKQCKKTTKKKSDVGKTHYLGEKKFFGEKKVLIELLNKILI